MAAMYIFYSSSGGLSNDLRCLRVDEVRYNLLIIS
jgi:hypothetical protein